jgi:hypothetical protein
MINRHWWQFVKGREFGERSEQETEDWIVTHVIAKYAEQALQALERLHRIKDDCSEATFLTIEKRWKQIFEICKSALHGRVSQRSGPTLGFEYGDLLHKAGLADPES